VELLPDTAKMIDRRLETPGPQLVAILLARLRRSAAGLTELRLDLRGEQLALAQPAVLHGRDDHVDVVGACGARPLAETVCLDAEPHPANLCLGEPARQGGRQASDRQLSEFASCIHDGPHRVNADLNPQTPIQARYRLAARLLCGKAQKGRPASGASS